MKKKNVKPHLDYVTSETLPTVWTQYAGQWVKDAYDMLQPDWKPEHIYQKLMDGSMFLFDSSNQDGCVIAKINIDAFGVKEFFVVLAWKVNKDLDAINSYFDEVKRLALKGGCLLVGFSTNQRMMMKRCSDKSDVMNNFKFTIAYYQMNLQKDFIKYPLIIGVDAAREGTDRTVIDGVERKDE